MHIHENRRNPAQARHYLSRLSSSYKVARWRTKLENVGLILSASVSWTALCPLYNYWLFWFTAMKTLRMADQISGSDFWKSMCSIFLGNFITIPCKFWQHCYEKCKTLNRNHILTYFHWSNQLCLSDISNAKISYDCQQRRRELNSIV